jgi:hypothetical protein
MYLIFWWCIPPPQTRYLLAVLPPLLILLYGSVINLPQKFYRLKHWSITFTFISILLNLFIRIGASAKQLPYLLGYQTKQQYLDSRTTDFNRDLIDKFYSGYWQSYQYP